MNNKYIEDDRYFKIDIKEVYILNMLLLWSEYLMGNQVDEQKETDTSGRC